MWKPDEIEISIRDAEGGDPPIIFVEVTVPGGMVSIMGAIRIVGDTLYLDGVHIGGMQPGACGRSGLNAMGRKFLEVADVKKIVIQGSHRTTGAKPGSLPRRIVFPRR